jgi:hypothetical protein
VRAGSPPYNDKYTLDPEGIWFFHSNDASENSAGYAKKIQLWNRALSDAEVRAQCGCELPANGKACKYSNTYVPTYLRLTFSSSYNRDPPGVSHGLGRLNSVQAWSAAQPVIGEYLELQIGEEVSVSGIVTQGRNGAGQWVTAYKVQVRACLIPTIACLTLQVCESRLLVLLPPLAAHLRSAPALRTGFRSETDRHVFVCR